MVKRQVLDYKLLLGLDFAGSNNGNDKSCCHRTIFSDAITDFIDYIEDPTIVLRCLCCISLLFLHNSAPPVVVSR